MFIVDLVVKTSGKKAVLIYKNGKKMKLLCQVKRIGTMINKQRFSRTSIAFYLTKSLRP